MGNWVAFGKGISFSPDRALVYCIWIRQSKTALLRLGFGGQAPGWVPAGKEGGAARSGLSLAASSAAMKGGGGSFADEQEEGA
jgi:hypothetical protein